MPAKTSAKPARKPVRGKVSRAATIARTAIAKTVKAKPAKPKIASKVTSKIASRRAPDGGLPAVKSGKTVSVVTAGRYVPSKILHAGVSTPVSTLLARVSGAIEDELTQIEAIVAGGVSLREYGKAERRARTLASLARTLREVMQLRAGEEKTKRDDDAVPRDIGELRAELARRLDRIVADAKAAHPGEPE